MAGAQEVFNGPVSGTYASTASNALGALGGALRVETAVGGKSYRLVKAGASVAAGEILQLDTATANAGGTIVEGAKASTYPVYGICQAQSCAANGYFWAQVGGVATVASSYLDTDNVGAANNMVQLNSDFIRMASQGTATLKQNIRAFGQALNSWATDATHVVSVMLEGNVGK